MFVVAGVESLSSFMSMLALNLTDWPDERAKIIADLALLPQAIEESLRFNTSAQRFKRTLTRDIEIHGQVMHAGDYVVLAYGAANRDPRKFTDPDRYDIGRKPQGHLGFGTGKHFCIGSQFSRLVSDVAMGAFLQRIPHFRRSNADLAWISSSNFRSPLSLPLQIANS
jgi:cytochrome P450